MVRESFVYKTTMANRGRCKNNTDLPFQYSSQGAEFCFVSHRHTTYTHHAYAWEKKSYD